MKKTFCDVCEREIEQGDAIALKTEANFRGMQFSLLYKLMIAVREKDISSMRVAELCEECAKGTLDEIVNHMKSSIASLYALGRTESRGKKLKDNTSVDIKS